ncbi:MAG: ABC transporter permease [Verrucomicrobia bacterium]|nr:ABC transporter permease [Verrucomicrobiota bacterium]
MDRLLPSLRYTIRLLAKSPGFTVTAVLILAFGIGVNTAIFSLIDSVLLKPLPFPQSDRVVQIEMQHVNGSPEATDYPDYVELRRAQHSFDNLCVTHWDFLDLSGAAQPERLSVHFVSEGAFKLSGRPFLLGRPFTDREDVPHGPLVAVLSERFWRQHFNSDPTVIGKNLTLSDQSFEIIGIAPQQIDDWGMRSVDVYLPINTITVYGYFLNSRDAHWLGCMARLKDGIGLAQAQQDLGVISSNLATQYPETNKSYSLRVLSLLDAMVGSYSSNIWLLGVAAGCLLLISCANIANLLFARSVERRLEMTIRSALGASRSRLISQWLGETLLLTFLGGCLGLFIAIGFLQTIKALAPQDLYRFQALRLEVPALLFVIALIVFISLLSGFMPAWSASATNLGSAIKETGGRSGTGSYERQRVQSVLVTGQVALAGVLLIGSSLLARSFVAVQNVPLGFNPRGIVTGEIFLTSTKYELDGVRTRSFWDAVLEKTRKIPGVTGVGMNDNLPFYYSWSATDSFSVVGQVAPVPGHEPRLDSHMISPEYFRTMEIPLLKGRDFDHSDKIETEKVTIIDEALADRFFGSTDPIGKQISVRTQEGTASWTIVGVVPHINHNTPDYPGQPFQAYFPYAQEDWDSEILVVRTQEDPGKIIPLLQKVIASIDPGVPIAQAKTFSDVIDSMLVVRRLAVLLTSILSSAALFLSAVGLYGVLSYAVAQRTREIGIRIALGAQVLNILKIIVRPGLSIVGIGLVVGIIGALILTHLIQNMLYGVSGSDPVTLGFATVVLGLTALLACLFPAINAIRINPIKVLRE